MDYTIGQLAKLSGVTVRALHHYEKLGLLPPSGRTGSGYRHYGEPDVLRLHRILACRQMGIPLRNIAPYLGPDAPPLQALLAQQAIAIQAELERLQKLLSLLERVAVVARNDTSPDLSDQLLDLMTAMQAIEQHYSTSELEQLRQLRDAISPEDRLTMKAELADLLQQFGDALSRGTGPADSGVHALAMRWRKLGTLAAPAAQLRTRTRALIDSEPQLQRATGITPRLKAYIDAAVATLGPAG